MIEIIAALALAFEAGGLSSPNNMPSLRPVSEGVQTVDMAKEIGKNMRELSNKEIIRELSGKYIIPTGDVVADEFSEFFYKNGLWKGSREQRVAKQYSGKWIVQNNKICVHIGESNTCRGVYKDIKTGVLCITDFMSSISKSKLLAVKFFDIK